MNDNMKLRIMHILHLHLSVLYIVLEYELK